MKKLLLPLLSIIFFSCQKECLPPPCEPTYFADLTLKEKQGIKYTLLIDEIPVTSWKGDTSSQGRTIDISERYFGDPADFRVRAFIDLGGLNIDGIYYYSDVFRDSVRVPGERKLELVDQSGSGVLSVTREGGRNKILVRNSLECASQARLTYNGRDTLLNLADRNAGTAGGSDYRFETTDSVFNITFQLLTPCEFYPRELMKVSSASIQDFNINPTLAVRKEDCGEIKK